VRDVARNHDQCSPTEHSESLRTVSTGEQSQLKGEVIVLSGGSSRDPASCGCCSDLASNVLLQLREYIHLCIGAAVLDPRNPPPEPLEEREVVQQWHELKVQHTVEGSKTLEV
jgi:hypothetical protein